MDDKTHEDFYDMDGTLNKWDDKKGKYILIGWDDKTIEGYKLQEIKDDLADILQMVNNYYNPNVDIQGIRNKLINLQVKVNRL